MPDPSIHWHAFEWTGHERPADSERRNPQNRVPPLAIAEWLDKPASFVAQTYGPDEVDSAYAWLEGELKQHPRASHDIDADPLLEAVHDYLARGADVVWGYYSAKGRYVSRVLIACPRE
ncbi:hypothetical protein ACFWGV_21805, partial [Bacillus subtilis]